MKTSLLPLMIFFTIATHAQNSYLFRVTDTNLIPNITLQPNSVNNVLAQTLYNTLGVTKFEKAHPSSNYFFRRNIYQITATDNSLLNTLQTAFPGKFEYLGTVNNGSPLCYHPNDYSNVVITTGRQIELDFIRADTAWCYSTGDSNTVIGISDSYIMTSQIDLKNKKKQIAGLQNFYPVATYVTHGTMVAGIAAGHTNNDTLLSSIGYNCRFTNHSPFPNSLEFESRLGMEKLASNDLRILNASWVLPAQFNSRMCQTPANFDEYDLGGGNPTGEQISYNELYEKGCIVVCGAGNGITTAPYSCANDGIMFPASLNHNISVTSVGHFYDTNHTNSQADNHYFNNNSSSFNHNFRVDIAAPGQRVTVLDSALHPFFGVQMTTDDGTSLSAPFVSGTIGLMLSANPALSPYQVEWLLKKTANDSPYLHPANAALVAQKQLGAGRLDAGEAVKQAKFYDVNDPLTRSLYISGIEFNTRCKPGLVSGLNPKFKPVVQNKTAGSTLSYRWIPLPGNTVTLDNYNIAEPTITSATGNTAYFMLDVYENITVNNQGGRSIDAPKIAHRQVKLDFITNASAYDLALRDSYLDMLDEPNSQATVDPREWNIWDSPDLWNRQAADGGLDHQNPEYFSTDSNYLYVRVRNTGCAASPAYSPSAKIPKLRLYWSKLSTGQSWDWDWKYEDVYSPVTGTFLPGGREITDANDGMPIPSVPAGKDTILRKGWRPVKPQDYDSASNNEMLVCGLARIETAGTAPWGMTNEVINSNTSATGNVRNNNNIVIRNMVTLNYNTGNRKKRIPIDLINQGASEQAFALELFNDKVVHKYFSGNLSGLMTVTLFLGDAFGYWQAGGSHGTGILSVDESAQTIVWNGKEKLRLDSVMMPADTRATIILYPEIAAGTPLPFDMTDRLHFRQMLPSAAGAGDEIYGSVTMAIAIAAEADGGGDTAGRAANGIFSKNPEPGIRIYPNPAHSEVRVVHGREQPVRYRLSDIAGKTIQRGTLKAPEDNISIGHLAAGVYILEIRDEQKSVVRLVKW